MKARWTVKIPEGAVLKVKKADKVSEKGELFSFCRQKIEHYGVDRCFWEDLNKLWVNQQIKEGQLLVKRGFWRSKKLLSPATGKCLGLSEFGDLGIEVGKEEGRMVSPVKAKVVEVGKEKISLEFEASEIKGEVIIGGKVWGDLEDELKEGTIVVLEKLDEMTLVKAWALGVLGIVSGEIVGEKIGEREDGPELPVLRVGRENLFKLKKEIGNRAWLNAKLGRLLVVLK